MKWALFLILAAVETVPAQTGCGPDEPAVEGDRTTLAAGVRSPCPSLRRASLRALAESGDPAAGPVIAGAVGDPDPETAARACWALGELRDRGGGAAAARGTEPARPIEVRQQCAVALGRIGDAAAGPRLEQLALSKREDPAVRIASIRALTMLSRAPAILTLLSDTDAAVRAAAAYAACQLNLREATPAVRSMLANPAERKTALDAASLWPKPFAPQLLAQALNDDSPIEHRLESLSALSLVGDAGGDVMRLLDRHQPEELQAAVVQILADRRDTHTLRRMAANWSTAAAERSKLDELGYPGPASISNWILILLAGTLAGTVAQLPWWRDRFVLRWAASFTVAVVTAFSLRMLFLAALDRFAGLNPALDPGRLWPAFIIAVLIATAQANLMARLTADITRPRRAQSSD